MTRRYLLNLAVAADQGWNAILGGNPDETGVHDIFQAAVVDWQGLLS